MRGPSTAELCRHKELNTLIRKLSDVMINLLPIAEQNSPVAQSTVLTGHADWQRPTNE